LIESFQEDSMNDYPKSLFVGAMSLAVAVALSACGGGGGGGGSSAVPATSVTGTASKGLVKQARVLVCRIVNGAPEAVASCASGTTGADGSFSITMSDGYTGPAMVKVMAATGSLMTDETTGSDVAYNMTMRAVVPAVSATTTCYVTPFSEMAAGAVGTSGIDAAKMTLAMNTVQTLMTGLGIDLTVKPMMDLKNNGSDAAMLGRQSNMVKQLARVTMAAKNAGTLTDSSGTACNAAGTSTSQQVACAVAAMSRVMTGAGTTDATRASIMLAALNAQNPTSVTMPIMKADGTIDMEMADMTSSTSMQSAMLRAGMSSAAATGTIPGMMQGMH
jgi:hypothetical protein